jgi:hypothetical protein
LPKRPPGRPLAGGSRRADDGKPKTKLLDRNWIFTYIIQIGTKMITKEKAQEIATKEAIRQGYDSARFVKKTGETLVFACSFDTEDPNKLPEIGKPLFLEIKDGKVNYYSGLKYLQ